MAPAPKAELLDINSATATSLGARQASARLFGQDHRGPPYEGKDDLVSKGHRPRRPMTGSRNKIIASRRS